MGKTGEHYGGYRKTDDPAYREAKEIWSWLTDGNLEQLEFASQVVESFPNGKDGYFGRLWVVHAVDSGCLKSVSWMINKGVDLCVDDGGGYSPLHSCIELDKGEKYSILNALIEAGADINKRGIHGWTPLHMAAVRDDEQAMRKLLNAGADRTIKTIIDNYATPEEEARILGHHKSADFIANFKPQ